MRYLITQVKENGKEISRKVGTNVGDVEYVMDGFCHWWRNGAQYNVATATVTDKGGNVFTFTQIPENLEI